MATTTLMGAIMSVKDLTDKAVKVLGITRNKVEDMLSGSKNDNLVKQVAGSISIFPIIMTNDIPINAASVLTASLELEYANYMTLTLANSPKVKISDINDSKYLRQYHTNLSKLESVISDIYDYSDPMEAALGRAAMDSAIYNREISRSVSNKLYSQMTEAMVPKKQIYGLDWLMEAGADKEWTDAADSAAEKMNDARTRVSTTAGTDAQEIYNRTRQEINDARQRAREQAQDARAARDEARANRQEQHNLDREAEEDRRYERSERRQARKDGFGLAKDITSIGSTISSETRNWMKYANDEKRAKAREQREIEKTQREIEDTKHSKMSRNFDKMYNYKSINEMQPIPVVANIFTVDDNGTPSRQIEVVSGVKAKIHPINKQEIFQLVSSDNGGNLLTQIIRFTTGEIHFFRDILLNTNSVKEYASKMSKYHSTGAKVLGTLRRVQDLNRMGENLKPNATLVVSKACVEELKRKVGIDLLDEDDATKLCEDLSLIKFIVVDSLGGKFHILMPGMHDTFSVMSTDTLEKQVDAVQDAALTKELRKVISSKE